jgi:hypothetical protein
MLFALQHLQHPRDALPPGLEKQRDSPDKQALLLYFGRADVTKWFISQLGSLAYMPTDIVRRLRNMIDWIHPLSDHHFLQVLAVDKWPSFRTHLSKLKSESDLKAVKSLVSVLVARQHLGPKVHDSLIRLIVSESNIYHLEKMIPLLPDVRDIGVDDLLILVNALGLVCRLSSSSRQMTTLLPLARRIVEALKDHKTTRSYSPRDVTDVMKCVASVEVLEALWDYVVRIRSGKS